MKGNIDAYVLWPLNKMVQNWIVDWSTVRDFTVVNANLLRQNDPVLNISNQLYFEKAPHNLFCDK